MGLSKLLPVLVLFTLQEPGLVEASFNTPCPRVKVDCHVRERNQCTRHSQCPKKMKCCQFNCAKKCLDIKQDICSFSKDPGPCLAYLPRWWYDKEAQTCSEFVYGGCLGNNNNFQSESVCETICKNTCAWSQEDHLLQSTKPRHVSE